MVFQENRSFDRYFGTYPYALNPPGEPRFVPAPGTPTVNGLTPVLLTHNPNLANPVRLGPDVGNTCGSNHAYLAEQTAYDMGLVDKFVQADGPTAPGCDPTKVMDYYDGNTVTALWNYAQHFSMSDNSFGTTFGPSHIGAINLISGNNHGLVLSQPSSAIVDGTQIGNVEPTYDDCPVDPVNIHFTGRNIGDLLNARGVSWGWFSDGFKPTSRLADGTPVCDETRTSKFGVTDTVYDSGNSPFQYYQSTSNQLHLRPTSTSAIGHADRANHEYDLTDFYAAADADNLPAVSFLKAGGYQQGGGDDSDPLDEQEFIVGLVNHLERLPTWRSTAVVVMYDDSDGAYDHVMPPIVNDSQTLSRRPHRLGNVRHERSDPRRIPGQVRTRPAAPVPDHLPLGQGQPRRQHADRPDVGDPLRRGQLARRRADRRRLIRRVVGAPHRDVRLRKPRSAGAKAVPGSQHRRAPPSVRRGPWRGRGGHAGPRHKGADQTP